MLHKVNRFRVLVVDDEIENRLSVSFLGKQVDGWDTETERIALEFVRCPSHEIPKEAKKLARTVEWVHDLPGKHLRTHLVQSKYEARNYTEVSASTSESPE